MNALGGTFGKYYLTEKIATGGMAEIYLAKLIGPGGFEKQLVLKLIHPELSDERRFVEMFVAEAKTLVALTHGNIVPVYELGVVDGTYFLAMEYIDGPPLAGLEGKLAEAGERFTPAIATYVTAEVLKGLDYAHRKGESVIHRDLSPRNVMLSREGEVKLVDFGLAVTELSQSGRRRQSDLPAGSFPYMSPEQVRQEPLDRTTDLFSAGIILWEMLTGDRLFHRDGADETLNAVLHAEIPPPSSRVPDLPPALDAICAKALARDRNERYSSASAFLADANRFLYSLDKPPSPGDLATLVARRCPPVVASDRDDEVADYDSAEDDDDPGTVPMGDRTVKPREGTVPFGTRRRGKRRTETATFATHAAFGDVLANATPLFPIAAIDELEANVRKANDGSTPPAAEAPAAAPSAMRLPLRLFGLLALVSAGVGIGLVLASNGASGESPADAAAVVAIDAGVSKGDAAIALTPAPDAGSVQPLARDAAPTPPRSRDAGAKRRPDAAAPSNAKGLLRVGAKPWGDVYIDGTKVGQAPGQFEVRAGKHKVEVRYPVKGHEQSKSFSVTIEADKQASIGVVDFTAH